MKRVVLALLAVALGVAGLFAATAVARSGSHATVALRRTSLGSVLVNSRGFTLYLFRKDRNGKSSCVGKCATFWPPLIVHGKPTAGPNVKQSLLGMTRRAGGVLQATYNGHPLYRFVLDKQPSQTKGEGLFEFGAKWFALSARGTAVIKSSSSTTTGTTTTTCAYPPC
jgi:predicted lipoprotein with Yx(FWY)xxD motif